MQVKPSPEDRLRKYLKEKYVGRCMSRIINTELASVYIYKKKKFLSIEEAEEYKELVDFIKNEKEIHKEWLKKSKQKHLQVIQDLWDEK